VDGAPLAEGEVSTMQDGTAFLGKGIRQLTTPTTTITTASILVV